MANRSSNTFKRNLSLPNGVGVIDADYYNNPNNEGEIFVQMLNYGVRPLHIHKGDRIAQGIFIKYLKTDDDDPISRQRISGFGSTNERRMINGKSKTQYKCRSCGYISASYLGRCPNCGAWNQFEKRLKKYKSVLLRLQLVV